MPKVLMFLAILISALLPMGSVAAKPADMALRINEIYANAPGSSETGHEFIELYNGTSETIGLDDLALTDKDKPAKQLPLSGNIAAGQYLAIISTSDFNLVNSGATLQLVRLLPDASAELIDEVTYPAAETDASSWSFFTEGWELAPVTKAQTNERFPEEPEPDACPNLEGVQATVPEGYELDEAGNCAAIAPELLCQVMLSEVLANPAGVDIGREYVELHNPTEESQSLEHCQLQLGDSTPQSLPNIEIAPSQYRTLSDEEFSLTLTNTGGELKLLGGEREISVTYPALGDDQAWALIGTDWQLTHKPTPNAPNELVVPTQAGGSGGGDEELTPCGPGKERNPETNRCRTIVTSEDQLAICPAGQIRNPLTNRCRSATTTTASLAPCNAGEERNPETNRCRKVSAASTSLAACDIGEERNPETNRCRKVQAATTLAGATNPEAGGTESSKVGGIDYRIIGVIAFVAIGYGVYEYRQEIGGFMKRFVAKIGGKG